MSKIGYSIRRLLGRTSAEDALDEEVRFHLEMSIEQKMRSGMDPKEARQSALRDFGGVEQIKEQTREAWGLRALFDTWRDIRFACRQIGKRKGYAAVIVLTLAICLGANTAAFSLLRNLVLEPYIYERPDEVQIVGLRSTKRSGDSLSNLSAPEVQFLIDHSSSFSSGGLIDPGNEVDLETESGVERIVMDLITPGVWDAVAVAPIAGRVFSEADLADGNDRVVVVSYDVWKRGRAAGRSVVGDQIEVDGEPVEVIGAMPKGFYFGYERADVWMPRMIRADESPNDHSYHFVGRLEHGVNPEQAKAELSQVLEAYLLARPDMREWMERDGTIFDLVAAADLLTEPMPMMSMVFFSVQLVTVIVLVIGCLNISGMIMVRSTARMKEFCMRRALGASKLRIARQLLTEIVVLYLLGGVASLLVVASCYRGFLFLRLDEVPWGQAHELDFGILGVTFAVAFVAAVFSGGIPLFGILGEQLHQKIQAEGARSSVNRSRHRLHTAFVVGQVAFSLTLLILAGVFAGNLHGVLQRDPGFEREGRLSLSVPHPAYRFGTEGEDGYRDEVTALRARMIEKLETEPGVVSVGASSRIPSTPYNTGHSRFTFFHYEFEEGEERPFALRHAVSPDYFKTVGTRLVAGRDFADYDDWEAEKVVIVNRALVDRYFPGTDPLGMKIHTRGKELTIVGVADEVRDKPYFMEENDYTIYFPMEQWRRERSSSIFFVHVAGDPNQFRGRLRELILSVDPEATLEVETMAESYEIATFTYELPMILTVFFSGIALLLTGLGLYGLISYTVAERTKEFGIRMALGAPVGTIGAIVAKSSAARVGIGIGIGASVAFLLCLKIKPVISDFNATSLPLFLAAIGFVAIIAALASFLPALRAARIDPATALRYQ